MSVTVIPQVIFAVDTSNVSAKSVRVKETVNLRVCISYGSQQKHNERQLDARSRNCPKPKLASPLVKVTNVRMENLPQKAMPNAFQ